MDFATLALIALVGQREKWTEQAHQRDQRQGGEVHS